MDKNNLTFLGPWKFTKDGNTWETLEIWESGREGTLAPQSIWFKYKDRWISAYERKVRDWPWPSGVEWLKIFYSEPLMQLLPNYKNPFLKLIPKDDGLFWAPIPIPIIYGQE